MSKLRHILATSGLNTLKLGTFPSLCSAFCLLSSLAAAQVPDLADKSLEELANIQVYSASKHLQKVSDAPASVTIVTYEDIQKYGYRTLSDILESVRGFYVTYDRDYSFVGVRGFGRLGDSNNRLLVLIDGHRINDNVFGQPYLGSEFLLDVDLIERVEIVRGPSSSLYGADAFFGVINVITRKSPQLKGLEFSFEPASFGTYEGRASYAGKYRGVDTMLSGTFYDSQGSTLFFPEYNTRTNNNGITAGADYESFQHLVGSVSFSGFTLQGLFSARDKGVPTGYFGALFNNPGTQNYDYHQYLDLSYRRNFAERWDFSGRASYDQARLQAPVIYSSGLPDGSTTPVTFSFRGNWWDSEAKLTHVFWRKHQITFGTEVTDNVRQDQGDYTPIANSFLSAPYSSVIWALYGQDEFRITSKISLSGGIRYDHYSDFGGSTNPRLGLIYHVLHPTTLKLLYGTAFRAPEPFEQNPDFALFDSNFNLKPETIRSVEGVVEQEVGSHVNVSASIFRNWIDNLISVERNPSDGNSINRNVENATATGAEFEVDGHTSGGLKGVASYSFTNAVQPSTQQNLANSPQQLGKLNFSVPFLQQKIFASANAQYTSPARTLEDKSVGGFTVVNATILGHAITNHVDLSASVYNLFDKKYFDPGRPEDIEDSIRQDGRNFRAKITVRF